MDKRTTAYNRLKELLEEVSDAEASESTEAVHTEWIRSAEAAIKRMFADSTQHLNALSNIGYSPSIFTIDTPQSYFDECYAGAVRESWSVVRSIVKEFEDYELDTEIPTNGVESMGLTKKIFVVHGHDNEMKQTVARFIEKIGYEPIILHEQASGGATVIEKFERNADVSYAVVLLSPDDIGNAKDKSDALNNRARQNVVLELGYFIGKLGRSHVCPLVRGDLEVPSDFAGVVYIPYENDSWKHHIIQEMKHLGFDVDANSAFA